MLSSTDKVITIKPVADVFGTSPTTIRRLMKRDPDFPPAFRLSPKGEWRWIERDVYAYRDRKARRQEVEPSKVAA